MSHLAGLTADYSYRTADLEALERIAKSKFTSKRTARAIRNAIAEISTDRYRIKSLAHEVSEWRWKVGGADYQMSGRKAFMMMKEGLRNITGRVPLPLVDDDFKG